MVKILVYILGILLVAALGLYIETQTGGNTSFKYPNAKKYAQGYQ